MRILENKRILESIHNISISQRRVCKKYLHYFPNQLQFIDEEKRESFVSKSKYINTMLKCEF